MTDHELDKLTSTPIQIAYRAARRAVGGREVQKCLAAHGSTTGVLSDVPQSRRPACLTALKLLAAGDKRPPTDAAFAAVRAKAYGAKPAAPPVKSFDELAASAYQRFNNPPPKPTKEDA